MDNYFENVHNIARQRERNAMRAFFETADIQQNGLSLFVFRRLFSSVRAITDSHK